MEFGASKRGFSSLPAICVLLFFLLGEGGDDVVVCRGDKAIHEGRAGLELGLGLGHIGGEDPARGRRGEGRGGG